MNRSENVMTRRDLFAWIARGSLFATFSGFVVVVFKYLTPNVLFEPSSVFKIGKPDDYPPGTVTFITDRKLFVANKDDGFSVISAVCTHLGCTVNLTPDAEFDCPCHGSKFDSSGGILAGPVQKPLKNYKVSITRNGFLMVDMKKEVPPDFRLSVG